MFLLIHLSVVAVADRVTNYNNLQVKHSSAGWNEVHPAEAIEMYMNRDKIKLLEDYV